MKQTNKQQNKFISEYIKTLNPELAAKNAGYKAKDLKLISENLLSNNIVINEVKNQIKKQISSLQIYKGYVIQKLLEIAEFSLEEEDVLDKEGGYTGKKKLRDATVGLRALEHLCKYLGFNTKNNEENSQESRIITINNLDENKI